MKYTVTEILLWYDGPQIVRGMCDGIDVLVIATEDDFKGIGVKLPASIMMGVVSSNIELRAALIQHRIGSAYTTELGGVGASFEMTKLPGNIPEEWLPDTGAFLLS